MSTGGHNFEVFVQDLAIGECQRLSDLLNGSLHVKGFSREGSVWVVLRNVQGNPLATLLGIEGIDSQRGGEVGPGGEGAAVHGANASSVAMEFPRVIVLEDNVAHIGIVAILNLLRHCVAVNSEDMLRISDLDDRVWVELQLKRVRIRLLIDSLDPQEPLFDVIDVVLSLFGVWHLEIIDTLLQGVHLCLNLIKRKFEY